MELIQKAIANRYSYPFIILIFLSLLAFAIPISKAHEHTRNIISVCEVFIAFWFFHMYTKYGIEPYVVLKDNVIKIGNKESNIKEINLKSVKEITFDRSKKMLKFDDYVLKLGQFKRKEAEELVKKIKYIRQHPETNS